MGNIDFKNPAVLKIALSAVLVIGALGVFFFSHFLPFGFPVQREKIEALKADFEKKSTDLARARATVADLPRFEAEYEQLHQRWELAAELLPADRQMSALLRKITLAAEQSGVELKSFRPVGPKAEQYYTELPLAIQAVGGYHQVGSFLAELANLRRIITVSQVELKTSNDKNNSLLTTQANFTASAYSLNTAPTAPPAAAAAAPAGEKKEGAPNARKS
jgi:type IV pilus assembly protein PilO